MHRADEPIDIENRPEQDHVVTVLSERISLILARSTEMFTDMVVEKLGGRSALDAIETLNYDEMDALVHKAFPFLRART